MKTFVTLITLVLLVLVSSVAFSQKIPSANNWYFAFDAASIIDSSRTGTEVINGNQEYRWYGNDTKNGLWCLQSTFYKDFLSGPKVTDIVTLKVKLQKTEGSILRIDIGLAMEDNSLYFYYYKKSINLNSEWQKIAWNMEEMKQSGIKNFYRFYLVFLIVSNDSGYVGANVAVDSLMGIDSTFGTTVIDDFKGIIATGINGVADQKQIPSGFVLNQNYPNPFNPSTMINYQLLTTDHITLKVYDVLGREVITLVDGQKSAGNHSVEFNAKNLPSGAYFYKLQTGVSVEMKKMLLLK